MLSATDRTESRLVVSAGEARRELARRELARRHMVDYSEYIAPYYRAARHHRLAGEYLEQVETYVRTEGRTGIGRLLIMQPPRHGKSEQASIHFPTWFLGRNPDKRVIIASYGLDLAGEFSKKARDIMMGNRFRTVFGELATFTPTEGRGERPVEISTDSRSVKAWDLAAPHRGGMVAAGVGGGITGKGAHLLVIDDPFKNREEAESQAHRDTVWEWWQSTAYTRLEPGGAVVGMLTHWHGDDWAGKILKAMANDASADRWTVVSLEALWEAPQAPEGMSFEEYHVQQMKAGIWVENEDELGRKPGEALWRDRYNEEDLLRIKANIGTYEWLSLYQQRPYAREGNLFSRNWFVIVETPPKIEEMRTRAWFWDKAGTASGSGGDYAAGGLMSVTKAGVVYVENVYRRRCRPLEREQAMARLAKATPGVIVWHQQDPGSAGLDSAQMTNMNLAREGITGRFETLSGDKETRAGPWSSALEAGRVQLVRGGWNEEFIEEHLTFPRGAFDDQVDMASWGFGKLAGRTGSGIWVE